MLELDIITTNYNESPPEIFLTEVKSGGWGFSDLFKLRGWLDYLKINNAIFVATKTKSNIDLYVNKAVALSTALVVLPDLKDAAQPLSFVTYNETPNPLDVSIWRFSYWVERIITTDLTHKKKCARSEERYVVLSNYLHAVNSGAFFCQTISERMEYLCRFFKDNPHVSANTAAEMSGLSFTGTYSDVSSNLFKRTFYQCEYNDLQISTMIEHKSRLTLMKYAVDFILFKNAGRSDLAQDSRTFQVLGHEFEFSSFDSLPLTFKDGIERIKNEPYFHRYPVFWQWFMWAYGGFIILDREREEYAHMSERTGIPLEEVPRALQAYDALFPTKGGWFVNTSPNAKFLKLKMFPVPFMGLGAHYRRRIYCKGNDFKELSVSGTHTISDLVSWNNSLVTLLNGK